MKKCSQKFKAQELSRTAQSPEFKKDWVFPLLIVLVLLSVNFRVMNTWFIIDDTANIFCSSLSTLQLLFDSGTYLFFNQLYFTPLQPIAIKLDWFLFGLNPLGYHIHNLLAAFLCCLIFYKFLKLFFPPFFSCLGTIIFSISLPVSFDIGWITMRHYLWGFFLMLMAVYLFKRWEIDKKHWLIALSLFCALLSFLFKEAYTVLPALIFFVASEKIKGRIYKSMPFFLLLAIYIIWRMSMLGSLGGIPGMTEQPLLQCARKLLTMPIDLAENLYGFPYLLPAILAIMAFISLKMTLVILFVTYIVICPFIFFSEGGFLLATKALAFVAVIAFSIAFIMNEVASRKKRILLIVFAIFLVPLLFGAILKIKDSENLIVHLSGQYKKAVQEIMDDKRQRVLIISNNAYYFSNLEDIYKNMMGKEFPFIKSLSGTEALPYIASYDYDKVIIGENFDLNPSIAQEVRVGVLGGAASSQFIAQSIASEEKLAPPQVSFIPEDNQLKIRTIDPREGTYLRCLHMGSYVGCYPVPREYRIKYNTIRKIDRIDMVFICPEGKVSSATSYVL